jgi:hypothetical protein
MLETRLCSRYLIPWEDLRRSERDQPERSWPARFVNLSFSAAV